jgi:hypothetical protein
MTDLINISSLTGLLFADDYNAQRQCHHWQERSDEAIPNRKCLVSFGYIILDILSLIYLFRCLIYPI